MSDEKEATELPRRGGSCTRCGKAWNGDAGWADVVVELKGFGGIATPLKSIEFWCPECLADPRVKVIR